MFPATKKVYLMITSQPAGSKKKDWLASMPELGIIADVHPVFVFPKSSADITPEVWVKLAREIYQSFDKAAGFVVLHGVDNLLYTSSALSFLLQNLTKPIIFTGSHGLPDIKKQEARANLINAFQSATCGLNEVALMFGNRLLRANQAGQGIEESLNVFTTPIEGILGRIDFSIRIFDQAITKNKGKIKLFDKLSNKIEIIQSSPVISLKALSERVADKEGIIVNMSQYQNLSQDLMFFLEKITADIPVVIWTNQPQAKILASKNVLLINNLTWETAVVKFMWVLGQTKSIRQVKELMAKEIVGEIIE